MGRSSRAQRLEIFGNHPGLAKLLLDLAALGVAGGHDAGAGREAQRFGLGLLGEQHGGKIWSMLDDDEYERAKSAVLGEETS